MSPTRSSPASGFSSPTIMRKSVVLPAPFGPITPTMPPGGSEKVRSSNSSLSPNPFDDALGLDDDVAEPRAGRDVDLDAVELHVLLLARAGARRRCRRAFAFACRAFGLMRTHSSSRARVRRRADSVFSSTASRACFCSSHDE